MSYVESHLFRLVPAVQPEGYAAQAQVPGKV